jgi:hypothetical protein
MNGFVPFSVIVGVEALEDRAVDQRTFNVVASVIFALVALLHLLRIYMGWPIVIGSWTAPMWVSWIGLVVGGGLSYFGLSHPSPRASLWEALDIAKIRRKPQSLTRPSSGECRLYWCQTNLGNGDGR